MFITYFSGVDVQLRNLATFTLNAPPNKNSFILEPLSILLYCPIKAFVFICIKGVSAFPVLNTSTALIICHLHEIKHTGLVLQTETQSRAIPCVVKRK